MEKAKLIESYLDGSMTQDERVEFERSIKNDPELASEVSLSREINEAILDDGTLQFKKLIRNIIEMRSSRFRTIIRVLKVPVAASIILLIGFSLWQILLTKSPTKLYSSLYKPYQVDTSIRSVFNTADKSNLAYRRYSEGNYEESFNILQHYLNTDFTNQTAHFYIGLNALELGLFNVAKEELTPIEQDPSSPLSLHARWYLAMTYLRLDQPDDAKKYLEILVSKENMYSKKAKVALKKLKH